MAMRGNASSNHVKSDFLMDANQGVLRPLKIDPNIGNNAYSDANTTDRHYTEVCQSSPASTIPIITIFDFDDTLFPTTALRLNDSQSNNHLSSNAAQQQRSASSPINIASTATVTSAVGPHSLAELDNATKQQLSVLQTLIMVTLERAFRLSDRVYIVTNANHLWVEMICIKFYPQLFGYLQMQSEKYQRNLIISARHMFESKYPRNSIAWKFHTFHHLATDYCEQRMISSVNKCETTAYIGQNADLAYRQNAAISDADNSKFGSVNKRDINNIENDGNCENLINGDSNDTTKRNPLISVSPTSVSPPPPPTQNVSCDNNCQLISIGDGISEIKGVQLLQKYYEMQSPTKIKMISKTLKLKENPSVETVIRNMGWIYHNLPSIIATQLPYHHSL